VNLRIQFNRKKRNFSKVLTNDFFTPKGLNPTNILFLQKKKYALY